ncbi:hypothetical protein AK812_SmicGene38511 [Symbiodinium microadriaticum]|uniref:Uncharacterized protein n=1 Tax=Symbiodinium microadriaticum TaxID=2951 RepID=A0A1Q9CDI6_SYMMI|nr:hypothetical protein AK812_SmicGene38511 [Symbiodinium microadriaticum]
MLVAAKDVRRLCKFDGEGTRLMRSREFHQIAGRAGRKGFDTRGDVVAVDPDWVVHNRELQTQRAGPSQSRPPPRWRRPPRRPGMIPELFQY